MKTSTIMELCLGAVYMSMGVGVLGPARAYDTMVVTNGAVVRGQHEPCS